LLCAILVTTSITAFSRIASNKAFKSFTHTNPLKLQTNHEQSTTYTGHIDEVGFFPVKYLNTK